MTSNKNSGSQVAYLQLRQGIIEGRYPPGSRLVEQNLATELSVSRTPVREALRTLKAEGLVVHKPNRGAIVREISIPEISDLYDLRARLEGMAAEYAANRRTEAQLIEIDAGIAEFGAVIANPPAENRIRMLSAANRRIHSGIFQAAQNQRLADLISYTVDVPLVFAAFQQFDAAQVQNSHNFHILIRNAIANQEPQRAGSLMSEHVRQGRDALIAKLRADQTS